MRIPPSSSFYAVSISRNYECQTIKKQHPYKNFLPNARQKIDVFVKNINIK